MLSVCIPVYNYKIGDILLKLNYLCSESGITYELLVVDDCSKDDIKNFNKEAYNNITVNYIELPQNIGRAAIRNYLCKRAQYSNLLFLDCDSLICNDSFISNYLPYLNSGNIVYGGTAYQKNKPDRNLRLHWIYGQIREIKPVAVRNSFPTRYFKTNNFLIPREVLLKYPFDESIKGYGHEDTLMGINFYQNNIPVIHIENPVLHAGLETNKTFIHKTEEGIKNLVSIYKTNSEKEILKEHILLLRTYSRIEAFKLVSLIKYFWLLFGPVLLFIVSKFYFLKALDIYKLGLFCRLSK
jgi:glycosyltransferase involved in cell wall biosynthesis